MRSDSHREPMKHLSVLVVALPTLFIASWLAPRSDAGSGKVVLGTKSSFPYGSGWGAPRPRAVYNGGDPSGRAWNLHRTAWGASTATATGLTWIAPNAGHLWAKGRIELRASRIGHCSPGGPHAYTRLEAREAYFPSTHYSQWFLWSGRANLCR